MAKGEYKSLLCVKSRFFVNWPRYYAFTDQAIYANKFEIKWRLIWPHLINEIGFVVYNLLINPL